MIEKNKLNELLNNGLKLREISKKLDIPYSTLWYFTKRENIKHDNNFKNIKGKKFGKVMVIELSETKDNFRRKIWKCKCDCGNYFETRGTCLRSGNTKSCGCANQDKGLKMMGKDSIFWTGHEEITGSYWAACKIGAKNRGLSFNITKEYIWDLFIKQNRKCALSGLEINFSKSHQNHDGTASLDRIDSRIGYEIANLQWIHKSLQKIKNNMLEKDFFKWIKIIYEFKKLDAS